MIYLQFLQFQAAAIQQNINAVNDALQTLENLSKSSGRTFLHCYDLIKDASQIYNEASNSPASSALLQLANGIRSLGSTSCSQSQKAAVIQLLMSALDKLEGNLNNIRESIIEQGIIFFIFFHSLTNHLFCLYNQHSVIRYTYVCLALHIGFSSSSILQVEQYLLWMVVGVHGQSGVSVPRPVVEELRPDRENVTTQSRLSVVKTVSLMMMMMNKKKHVTLPHVS